MPLLPSIIKEALTDILPPLRLVDEGGHVAHDLDGLDEVGPVVVLLLGALDQLAQDERVLQDPLHGLDQDRTHVEARDLGF